MSRLKMMIGKSAIVSLLSLVMCVAGLVAHGRVESGQFIIKATLIEGAIAGTQNNKSRRVRKGRRVARRSRLAQRRSTAKPAVARRVAGKPHEIQGVIVDSSDNMPDNTITSQPSSNDSPVNSVTVVPVPKLPAQRGRVVSGGVLNSRAVRLPMPPYPPIARAARASGTVVVQVTVDEEGNVMDARAASGHPLLQTAATAAARAAKFTPTMLGGQPVKVTGVITYNFVLQLGCLSEAWRRRPPQRVLRIESVTGSVPLRAACLKLSCAMPSARLTWRIC
jgi:TonB family protein